MTYFACLAAVASVVGALPRRFRKAGLLCASLAFYAVWATPYLALVVGLGTLNYLGAIWIARGRRRERRGFCLVVVNLIVIGAFKYAATSPFAFASVPWRTGSDLGLPAWVLWLVLPVWACEAIGYVADVTSGRETPRSWVDIQLFLAFFPNALAGPIMRVGQLVPQFAAPLRPSAADVMEGIRQIVTGMVLKIVLADGLAEPLTHLLARRPAALGARDVWVIAIACGLQFYFELSAYSRIAIGSARLFGLRLVQNFAYPYSAISPSSFWDRWNMSLLRWVDDYVRAPLVRRSTSRLGAAFATCASMIVFGLCHAATWGWMAWGVAQGGWLSVARLAAIRRRAAEASSPPARTSRQFLLAPVSIAATIALVSLCGLLVRSRSLGDAASLVWIALSPWSRHVSRPLDMFDLEMFSGVVIVSLAGIVMPRLARWFDRLASRPERRYFYGTAIAEGVGAAALLILCLAYWNR